MDVHASWSSTSSSSARTRSRSACRLRSVAAFFSQDALSSNGNDAGVDARLARSSARPWRRADDDDVVGDRQVAEDHRAAADHAVRADGRAAGDADAAGHRRVRADAHVVADLDQVVDLDAVVDHGVVERAAVDAGVGADLDVVADDDRAELLDLLPAAAVRREAEAVGADARRRNGRCSARRSSCPRRASTRGAEPGRRADAAAGADDGVRADASRRRRSARRPRSTANGADRDVGAERALGSITALGWMPRGAARPRALGPPLRQAGEVEVGIVRDDRRAARRPRRRETPARRSRSRGRVRRQLLRVQRVGEKGDRRRASADSSGPIAAISVRRIADQFAAEPLDDLAQRDFAHLVAVLLAAALGVERLDHLVGDVDLRARRTPPPAGSGRTSRSRRSA